MSFWCKSKCLFFVYSGPNTPLCIFLKKKWPRFWFYPVCKILKDFTNWMFFFDTANKSQMIYESLSCKRKKKNYLQLCIKLFFFKSQYNFQNLYYLIGYINICSIYFQKLYCYIYKLKPSLKLLKLRYFLVFKIEN